MMPRINPVNYNWRKNVYICDEQPYQIDHFKDIYDMIHQYIYILFKKNITYVVMREFYNYVHYVEIPADDEMLYEMIKMMDHDELWTNMAFMDKFRERLIFYGLYYDIGQNHI